MKIILLFLFLLFPISTAYAQTGDDAPLSLDSITQKLVELFQSDGKGTVFLLFMLGLAIYSVFVWFFYRYISRRELIPKFYEKKQDFLKKSKIKIVLYLTAYAVLYPVIIFVWFLIYTFLIFVTSHDLSIDLVGFVSLSLLGVIRITAYFKEDLARDVGKTIPFSLLAIFLTSIPIYNNPNLIQIDYLVSSFSQMLQYLPGIISGVLILSILEIILRISFIIKRKFLPTSKENDS
ncbi:MAG: hypothetical protein HC944_05575 [Nanoarchaeota archaeon]|nr:hypothetical protein [Nanoarchaeota archaeon]